MAKLFHLVFVLVTVLICVFGKEESLAEDPTKPKLFKDTNPKLLRKGVGGAIVAALGAIVSVLDLFSWFENSQKCSFDDECTKAGCTCESDIDKEKSICYSLSAFAESIGSCEICTNDDQCEKECKILPEGDGTSLCRSCVEEAVKIGKESCDCISTKWLRRNGYGHGILRSGGSTRVLCLPGLPCGTPGHVLRHCQGSNCVLRTYSEICDSRADCTETELEVSQLRHDFDWSVLSAGTLTMTSVSMHPHAKFISTSRIIAHLGYILNRMGYGVVSDSIIIAKHGIMNAFRSTLKNILVSYSD